MSVAAKSARSVFSAALRVLAVVGMMTGPVYAVAMMKAAENPKVSGAGLVLFVSLERA
jgi:multisubunit Na+/H+ antiporter MnhG subunit